jgi:hypothetical protein
MMIMSVLSIIGAALSRFLADEFKEWVPWLVERLIDRAVRQLPTGYQQRFAEEWRSHVGDVPGQVGRLILAFGFLAAAWKVSLQRNSHLRPSPRFRLAAALQVLLAIGIAAALKSDMSTQAVCRWLMVMAAADAAFLVNLYIKHRLNMCRYYLAFVVAGGALQLICYSVQPRISPTTYWIAGVTQNVLLCGLMCEIAFHLLPYQYVRQCAASVVLVVAMLFIREAPGGTTDAIWYVSWSVAWATAALLAILWAIHEHRAKEFETAIGGVILVLFAEMLPAFLHLILPAIGRDKLCVFGECIDLVAMLLLGVGALSLTGRRRKLVNPASPVNLPA